MITSHFVERNQAIPLHKKEIFPGAHPAAFFLSVAFYVANTQRNV
jgi:hypothetical protein